MPTKPDDADRLRAAGEALYGALWQRALSRALDVNERRVRAWAARETRIPPTLWADIHRLLVAKVSQVTSQMIEVAAMMEASDA